MGSTSIILVLMQYMISVQKKIVYQTFGITIMIFNFDIGREKKLFKF